MQMKCALRVWHRQYCAVSLVAVHARCSGACVRAQRLGALACRQYQDMVESMSCPNLRVVQQDTIKVCVGGQH